MRWAYLLLFALFAALVPRTAPQAFASGRDGVSATHGVAELAAALKLGDGPTVDVQRAERLAPPPTVVHLRPRYTRLPAPTTLPLPSTTLMRLEPSAMSLRDQRVTIRSRRVASHVPRLDDPAWS